jgi:hypothetical protein
VILQGHVNNGAIIVTPLEDRHGGTIMTDIQYTPSSLKDQMSYYVENVNDDTTQLILKMPTEIHDEECIHLNMEIRLPYSADIIKLDVKNVDISMYPFIKDIKTIHVKNKNGNIRLDRWTGNRLSLTTMNGEIKLGRMISDESIYIEGASNDIVLTENMEAKNEIYIRNSNGQVKTLGAIQADNIVDIQSSNGLIHAGSILSDSVHIQTSNHGILVDYIKSKNQVIAETSNGPIAISIAGEKNNKVVLSTSSNPINLHMVIFIFHRCVFIKLICLLWLDK